MPAESTVEESARQAALIPGRYLSGYDLVMDDRYVLLSPSDLERMERDAGRYDASLPTGVYLGKLWLHRNCMCFYEADPARPETHCRVQIRQVLVVS